MTVELTLRFDCYRCGEMFVGNTIFTSIVPMKVDRHDFPVEARRSVMEQFSQGWEVRALGGRTVGLEGAQKHGWEAAQSHSLLIDGIPSLKGWQVVVKEYLDSEAAWLHLSKHAS